jgi:Uma2 family endonuclease
MVTQINELTLTEFFNLPPDEEDKTYELVDGQAIAKMSPKFFHAKLTYTLLNLLYQCCGSKGEVCPEWAIALTKKGRDWVPVPDIVYISYERLPIDWNENQACPVPPDLVIEIISPGQTFGKIATKAQNYLSAKVLRVWVIDSEEKSITIFYPDTPPQTYIGKEIIQDSLFVGLEFTPEQVFTIAKIP